MKSQSITAAIAKQDRFRLSKYLTHQIRNLSRHLESNLNELSGS